MSMTFRFQLFPGLSGHVDVTGNAKKKKALRLIREDLAGMCCGAKIYIERVHPKKINRCRSAKRRAIASMRKKAEQEILRIAIAWMKADIQDMQEFGDFGGYFRESSDIESFWGRNHDQF